MPITISTERIAQGDSLRFHFRAYDENRVVGEARLKRIYECKSMGLIHGLGVNEDYRRQGIGRRLVQQVLDSTNQDNMNYLFATILESNEPSINLFHSLGFVYRASWISKITGHVVCQYSITLRRNMATLGTIVQFGLMGLLFRLIYEVFKP